MKKIYVLLLAAVLCFTCCACSGSKSLDSACDEADKLIAEWHSEGRGGCVYKSEYMSEYDGFEVSIYMVNARYPTYVDNDDSAGYVKNKIVNVLCDELYPELKKIFEGYDVDIGIILCDSNGNNAYCTIDNGEVIYH